MAVALVPVVEMAAEGVEVAAELAQRGEGAVAPRMLLSAVVLLRRSQAAQVQQSSCHCRCGPCSCHHHHQAKFTQGNS